MKRERDVAVSKWIVQTISKRDAGRVTSWMRVVCATHAAVTLGSAVLLARRRKEAKQRLAAITTIRQRGRVRTQAQLHSCSCIAVHTSIASMTPLHSALCLHHPPPPHHHSPLHTCTPPPRAHLRVKSACTLPLKSLNPPTPNPRFPSIPFWNFLAISLVIKPKIAKWQKKMAADKLVDFLTLTLKS